MRRILAILAVTATLVGCSPEKPEQSRESLSGPAWKLTLRSTCTGSGPECEEAATAAERAETLTISRRNEAELNVLSSEGTRFCFATAAAQDARAVQDAIGILAGQYYKLPFPDPCREAVKALETRQLEFQKGCQTSEDCSYVNDWYNIVYGTQTLFTDRCSLIKPMVAGLTEALKQPENVRALRSAEANVRTTCGPAKLRVTGCGPRKPSFRTSDGPAVCIENRCQRDPNIALR
jgi:hypothetical protein